MYDKFQLPYSDFEFSAIGDEQATTFFRVSPEGDVYLINSLSNDNSFDRLQVGVKGYQQSKTFYNNHF